MAEQKNVKAQTPAPGGKKEEKKKTDKKTSKSSKKYAGSGRRTRNKLRRILKGQGWEAALAWANKHEALGFLRSTDCRATCPAAYDRALARYEARSKAA